MRIKITIFLLSAILVHLSAVAVFAQTPKAEAIRWYQPESSASDKPEEVIVVLSGKTNMQNSVRLLYDKIILINDKKEIFSPPPRPTSLPEKIQIDSSGYFEVRLPLPLVSVLIPFAVLRSGQQSEEIYQLSFKIQADRIVVQQNKPLLKKPKSSRGRVWLGLGVNYLSFSQDTTVPANLYFESFTQPSLFSAIDFTPTEQLEISLSYTKAPGKTKSSYELQVANERYAWQIASLDLTYFLQNGDLSWGPRLGLQFHDVPFLSRTLANEVEFLSSKVVMATLGGQFNKRMGHRLNLTSFMRYQYFVNSSSLYMVHKQTAFDGSIGLSYGFDSKWHCGLFWYGQYQRIVFTDHEDVGYKYLNGPKIDGSQRLLFSNLEFRLGFEY